MLLSWGCDRAASPPAPIPEPESRALRFAESRFYRHHDGFLSIDEPATLPAASATFLDDDDEVLGFVIDGLARAYDVRMLCYHHVVNDTIGGVPIAVTY